MVSLSFLLFFIFWGFQTLIESGDGGATVGEEPHDGGVWLELHKSDALTWADFLKLWGGTWGIEREKRQTRGEEWEGKIKNLIFSKY